MKERYCALALGILFLLVGVAGFIPGLVSLPAGAQPNIPLDAPSVTYDQAYGYILGLFPTNIFHNVVRIIVGIAGLAAYNNLNMARMFNRAFAIVYAAMAFMGLFPYSNTMFGLMPIHGNNVWVSAITAIIAAYYGFVIPAQEHNHDRQAFSQ